MENLEHVSILASVVVSLFVRMMMKTFDLGYNLGCENNLYKDFTHKAKHTYYILNLVEFRKAKACFTQQKKQEISGE
jgi:hypothetical protein